MKVSVLIPSRNEQFLVPTVKDLLAKARGEVEICVCVDGYWPQPPLPDGVKVLHFGSPKGMRPALNALAQMATGDYFLKADAHTLWDEGYDVKLTSDYHEDNWILIPRRYPLDPDKWAIEERTDHKYPIDYEYLCEPFSKHGDAVIGLHGTYWRDRRDQRLHIPIDEGMAAQGSAWFMSRKHWSSIGPLRSDLYGCFWYENQETSLRTWMSGGAQMVTKNTWYAHLFKGKRGRGYSTKGMGHEAATAYNSWFWLNDIPFEGRTRTFRWLLERFWPVPTWPDDLDEVFRRARVDFKNPYQVAA